MFQNNERLPCTSFHRCACLCQRYLVGEIEPVDKGRANRRCGRGSIKFQRRAYAMARKVDNFSQVSLLLEFG